MKNVSPYRFAAAIALAIAAAACLPAGASVVIYDNGSPDGLGAVLSEAFPFQLVADNFVLEEGANVITDVHWWGAFNEAPPALDNLQFGFAIFDNIDNDPLVSPTIVPAVQLTDQDVVLPGATLDLYEFDAVLQDPITLVPGQSYLLVLAYLAPYDLEWYWATSDQAGTHTVITEDQVLAGAGEMAFHLTGVIPEPATLLLLGIGLGGLALRRLRTALR